MSTIDLTQLPAPEVVELLDYKTIYQEHLAQFRTAMGDAWTAALESDAVVKVLEAGAYREMLLRARVGRAVLPLPAEGPSAVPAPQPGSG